MKFTIKTAPVKYPVSLKEAKEHLRLEIGQTEDDDYISSLIAAATDKAEQFLHRRLITQTWYYYLEKWPVGDTIIMPFGKLISVTSIKYKDEDGVESTWATSEYIVDIKTDPGEIVLGYGESFPTTTLYPSNAITIEFVCGYGTSGSDVPPMIRSAMLLIIEDLYENRGTEIIGVSTSKLKTIENLLLPKTLY